MVTCGGSSSVCLRCTALNAGCDAITMHNRKATVTTVFSLRSLSCPTRSNWIVAEKDFVIVHGRFSGIGQPVNWIAADVLRIKDGILIEHWDVIQDEATQEQSRSGRPMFGDKFPK